MLSEKEKYRYDRQIRLSSFGLKSQELLRNSSVIVIGAGGLGSPILLYLAGAGVGKLGIVDFDTINETNLPRQILFSTADIGNNKALAATEKIRKQNPFVEATAYPEKLDAALALDLFSQYDLIIDATDNFSTRYLINDVCLLFNKPFVFGSVYKTEGQLGVFNYLDGPTYRCLYPEPPTQVPSCEEVGIIGAVCGIIGARQANEAIKILTGTGTVQSGKIEFYNSLTGQSQSFSIQRNPSLKRLSADEIRLFNYPLYCGEDESKFHIAPEEMMQLMTEKSVQILDIRQEWEDPVISYEDLVRIPIQEIEKAANTLSRDKRIVVVCQYGTRSNMAVEYLRLKHNFNNIAQLKGGLVKLFGE